MNGATSVTGGPCVGHSVEKPRARILSRLAKYCRMFPSGGEITVVVEGAIRPAADLETEVAGIRDRVARGERLKDVCGEVSRATGLSRKALYDAVVARPSAG